MSVKLQNVAKQNISIDLIHYTIVKLYDVQLMNLVRLSGNVLSVMVYDNDFDR